MKGIQLLEITLLYTINMFKIETNIFGALASKGLHPGGGGVHNMLRVQVCAAHMGGFLGPNFSKQGSLFRQIFHKQGWVIQK